MEIQCLSFKKHFQNPTKSLTGTKASGVNTYSESSGISSVLLSISALESILDSTFVSVCTDDSAFDDFIAFVVFLCIN